MPRAGTAYVEAFRIPERAVTFAHVVRDEICPQLASSASHPKFCAVDVFGIEISHLLSVLQAVKLEGLRRIRGRQFQLGLTQNPSLAADIDGQQRQAIPLEADSASRA